MAESTQAIVHDTENIITEEAIQAGVQPEDFRTRQVFGVMAVTFILTAAIAFSMLFVVDKVGSETDMRMQETLTYPERMDLQHGSSAALNSFARVDGVDGEYRIPLSHAQELMVSEASPADAETSGLTDRASYNLAPIRRDLSAVQTRDQEAADMTSTQDTDIHVPLSAEDAQE